jgi:HSP20 family protein
MQRNRPTSLDIRRASDNSLQPITSLQTQINRMFNDFFSNDNWPLIPSTFQNFSRSGIVVPSVDLSESDKEYHITAELPGLSSDEVDITLNDNSLTISGEKKEEYEDSGENYLVCERSYGSFQRTIPLPQGADAEQAQASFNNGILTIDIPKRAEAISRSRKLEISQGQPSQRQQSGRRSSEESSGQGSRQTSASNQSSSRSQSAQGNQAGTGSYGGSANTEAGSSAGRSGSRSSQSEPESVA